MPWLKRKSSTSTADFNVDDENIDAYYKQLFAKMGTQGLIVAAYIAPAITLCQRQVRLGPPRSAADGAND